MHSYFICIIKNQSDLRYVELDGYITYSVLKTVIDPIYWKFIVYQAVYIHYPIKSSNNPKKTSLLPPPFRNE